MNNKNEELLMVRGICALLVILVHLVPNFYNAFLNPITDYLLASFFFLSGYFLKGEQLVPQLKKKMTKLARPFVFYFVSVAVVGGLLLGLTQGMTFVEWGRSVLTELFGKEFLDLLSPDLYLSNPLHRPLTVMWFFIQMMLATLIVLPVLNICRDSVQRKFLFALASFVISALLYTLFQRCPLKAQMLFFEVGIMLLGNMARQAGILATDHYEKIGYKITFLVICGAFIIMINAVNPGFTFMSSGKIGSNDNIIDVVLAAVETFLGTLWLFELCTLLKKINIVRRVLSYLGTNSQEYVYMHLIFGWLLTFIGLPIGLDYVYSDVFTGSISQNLMLFGIFVLNLLLCTLYTKLLAKVKASTKSSFIKDI